MRDMIGMRERFWAKVNKEGPLVKEEPGRCWMWTAARGSRGYGRFNIGGHIIEPAHRVSFALANGVLPPDLGVLHRCGVRLCVRPDHLYAGTPRDNIRDAIADGWKAASGDNNGKRTHPPKLGYEKAHEMRELYTTRKVTRTDLADYYNVSLGMVHLVLSGVAWPEK